MPNNRSILKQTTLFGVASSPHPVNHWYQSEMCRDHFEYAKSFFSLMYSNFTCFHFPNYKQASVTLTQSFTYPFMIMNLVFLCTVGFGVRLPGRKHRKVSKPPPCVTFQLRLVRNPVLQYRTCISSLTEMLFLSRKCSVFVIFRIRTCNIPLHVCDHVNVR